MLEFRDLDLYYGDAQALDRVSLGVEDGAIVAIIGANGAGKSSLIRAIAGIEKPRAGRILFRGRDITGGGGWRGAPGAGRPRQWTRCSRCFRLSRSVARSSPAPCRAGSSRCSPSGVARWGKPRW